MLIGLEMLATFLNLLGKNDATVYNSVNAYLTDYIL